MKRAIIKSSTIFTQIFLIKFRFLYNHCYCCCCIFADVPQDQLFLPLLSGITGDTVFLPLPPGKTYTLLALAVDHVGNRQPVDVTRAITVEFTLPKRTF